MNKYADEIDSKNEALSNSKPADFTILIVDDEADVQELFKLNLQRLGYKTAQASNSDEAISCYKQALKTTQAINAVILDLSLPGSMNGKEIAEKIRHLDPQAKIIVSSGNTAAAEMTQYQEHGFDAALEKNFNREIIEQVLNRVLLTK